ncbi:CD2-associated protein [Eumeta japonica]|uniref:CD2-associated protein n=1 Tax=Eumeta variegata TaxID=151549 RepID=A0A4C1Y1L0_EUMVA|nr:CD2-associated protein [Eumeta japonica]
MQRHLIACSARNAANSSEPNTFVIRTSGIQGRCRAVFSYQPANPDELQLCVGDELEVLGEVEEGWWQGRRQGRLGVFPSNFVVMISGDAPNAPSPAYEPAPALPPKPGTRRSYGFHI